MSIAKPDKVRVAPGGRDAGGFAIVAAIVILVILAGLAGFVVSLTTTQNMTLAQDVQGARAYQAASAGIEWGLHQWYREYTCPTSGGPTSSAPGLAGFSVQVTGSLTHMVGANSTGGIANASGAAGSRDIVLGSFIAGSLGDVQRGMRITGKGIGDGDPDNPIDVQVSHISGSTLRLTERNAAAVNGPVIFGIVTCTIEATATSSGTTPGSVGHVERTLRVVAEN